MNDLHTAQTPFLVLGRGSPTASSSASAAPGARLAASPWGIKATFVPTTQDAAAVLTKGLGSHRTDDFRALLENKELPPAIASASASLGKEASVAVLPSARAAKPHPPAGARASHPTCLWMPLPGRETLPAQPRRVSSSGVPPCPQPLPRPHKALLPACPHTGSWGHPQGVTAPLRDALPSCSVTEGLPEARVPPAGAGQRCAVLGEGSQPSTT